MAPSCPIHQLQVWQRKISKTQPPPSSPILFSTVLQAKALDYHELVPSLFHERDSHIPNSDSTLLLWPLQILLPLCVHTSGSLQGQPKGVVQRITPALTDLISELS